MLIHDGNKPRGLWRLACVQSLIDGSDGYTRGAILTVTSPGEKRTTLKRPLQRLYPLEVKAASLNHTKNGNEPNGVPEIANKEQMVDRPKRAAAIEARDRCKSIALYEQEDETLDSY